MDTATLIASLKAQAREREHQSALRALMFLESFAPHFGHLSAPFDVVRSIERGPEMLKTVMVEPQRTLRPFTARHQPARIRLARSQNLRAYRGSIWAKTGEETSRLKKAAKRMYRARSPTTAGTRPRLGATATWARAARTTA